MDYRVMYIINVQLVNRLQCYVLLVSIFSCCFARDVIEFGYPIKDNGETLVSAGGIFELGFFTPKGSSSGGRYVGIWYKVSPSTVVWVANRDAPVRSSHGVFRIRGDGKLQVWDESTGESLSSTEIETSQASPDHLTAKLMDSGNLVLGKTLWESFRNPTDTFLPGMEMGTDLKLTSWSKKDDPATGDFSFSLDDQESETQYIVRNKSVPYWKSGGKFASSNTIFDVVIANMLSNFALSKPENTKNKYIQKTKSRDYNGTRLVIMFNGTLAYQSLNKNNKGLDLIWSEPADQCSIFNACGEFGSCNANNSWPCKCLPGFKPVYREEWDSGDFSGGCTRKGSQCGKTFLNLTMMNARKPESPEYKVRDEAKCRDDCLESCKCNAYSFRAAKEIVSRRDSSSNSSTCSLWFESLHDVQEEYAGGRNLSIRVASPDLESTKKSCDPCGTNTIPYPLSTGPDCGDPMYFSFRCNSPNEAVTFKAVDGEYKVVSIDTDTRTFLIQVKSAYNCLARGSISLQLNQSLPFGVTNWCYTKSRNSNFQASPRKTFEIEVQWDAPHEPVCSSDSDCEEWENTNCSLASSDGKNRCLCNTDYKWNGNFLNCTLVQGRKEHEPLELSSSRKKTSFPFVIVFTVLSVVSLICASMWFIIWRRKKFKKQEKKVSDQRSKELLKLDTQKRIKHLMNSGEFVEEDEQGIDVPFFDFETIIAATNDFSDENKLGQGGYGPVYKGKFEGGHEIAVKRLSSVSGQGLQEFKNEVVLIAKLQHRNLVRLRGYCVKGDEKILLYEYMPNRSLDSFIFDKEQSKILDWEKRFNIILGIARGLLYLHQDSRLRIIHRDLKTSNILLDQDMEPKISDFGLARIVGGKQTEANTERVVGTYGYMSPEYALEGLFSVKSDAFSFGVVVLEIISGKRNTRLVPLLERPLSLLGYAWRLFTENRALDLMDPALRESCNDEQFLQCLKVALLCVQEDPSERPTMSTVVRMLDSESATVPNPQQPAFALKIGHTIASSSSSKPEETQGEITVTLEEGR